MDEIIKIPLGEYEQIVYWYGKAIDKIIRQSNVIKRQGRQNALLKLKLQEERIKKSVIGKKKRMEDSYESLNKMIEFVDKGLYIPSDVSSIAFCKIWDLYNEFCKSECVEPYHFRTLSRLLIAKGYTKKRKSDGIWFSFK